MGEIQAVIPPPYFFDHNWSEALVLNSSFRTTIDVPVSVDEGRRGLVDRPFRTMKAALLTYRSSTSGQVKSLLSSMTGTRTYLPLLCDQAEVTNISTNVISCNTIDKRFAVGYKAMLITFDADKKASNVHISTVTAKSSGSLTLGVAPGFGISGRTYIFPAMECDANAESTIGVNTDWVTGFVLVGKERTGSMALPVMQVPGTLPDGESSYQGIPVLSIPHDWTGAEEGEKIQAASNEIGIEPVTFAYGSATYQGSLNYLALDRTAAFRLIRFFESRAGSLFVFWNPAQTNDLDIVAKSSDTVWSINKSITDTQLLARRFLAIWSVDGSVQVRRIVSVTNGGITWTITLDAGVSYTLGQVIRTSFASLARFNTDEMQEEWTTDTVMKCSLKIIGLLANANGTGEYGSDEDDDFPEIPQEGDDTPPEDPWDVLTCDAAGVAVPMFFDATQARGSGKEPIRAADLNMPLAIKVRFKTGWVEDTSHPHSGTLSAELLTALLREHILEYQGPLSGEQLSRNPYHIRLTGIDPFIGWSHKTPNGIEVNREVWSATRTYRVGETERTLEVRLVAEWTDNREYGLWGTGFFLYAFAPDEVNESYEDGDPWAPANDAAFTKDDPFISALFASGGPADKYCHPQMIACGVVATSLHAPVGFDWIPPDRTRYTPCYARDPGVPWMFGAATKAALNAVFGTSTGGYNMGGITLGSDITSSTSDFFEYLCAENESGNGLTALKPTRAGWDPSVGNLTPQNGNDLSIKVCNPGQTAQKINHCAGHPDEPLEDIGGSHSCFRNNGDSTLYCCVSILGSALLTSTQSCTTTTIKYDIDCVAVDKDCRSENRGASYSVVLWDYGYNFGGNQDLRSIEYRAYVNDPDYDRQHWTIDDGFADWNAAVGTWTFASNIANTATVTSSSPLKAFAYFERDSQEYEDVRVITKYAGAVAAVAGIGLRMTFTAGNWQGFLCVVSRSAALATVYLLKANTLTVLAQKSVDITVADDAFLDAKIEGSHIAFRCNEVLVEADSCEFQDTEGKAGLVNLSNVTTPIFEADTNKTQVRDLNWRKVYGSTTLYNDRLIASVAPQMQPYYSGGCVSPGNGDCPDVCPCQTVSKSTQGSTSLTSDAYVEGYGPIAPIIDPDDENPPNPDQTCTGPGCEPTIGPCGSCPGPFVSLSAGLPAGCEDPAHPSEWLFKRGALYWTIAYINCA